MAAGYPISAPKLLSFYEKHRDDICAVSVDCGKLDYISSAGLRVMLIMQKGSAGGVTHYGVNEVVTEILSQAGFDSMHMRKRSFPFQCYMNWPIRDPRAYRQGMGASQGNVLVDDQTFLRLLYLINDTAEPKNTLKTFLSEASEAVLAVDCENSDPYKLCAAMWELKEESPQSFSKIRKTVLFDDIHANPVWRSLDRFLPVPVEHILTQRVNDHKSLVDIQMTAGVARVHYAGGVDSFLLASSDSDYWGLIRSLPTARFMVLMEREKVSDSLTEALDSNGIGYYCIDNVDTEKVRNAALDEGVRSELPEVNLEAVLEKMRIQMGEEERKVYLLNGTLFDPEIAHYLIPRGTPDIDQNTKWKGKSSLLYATYSCK